MPCLGQKKKAVYFKVSKIFSVLAIDDATVYLAAKQAVFDF